MREDYNIDEEEIFGDSEDVLNLLQEYNEESSNLLKEDDFDDGKMSFDDGTDEDLLALLDMISKSEESDGVLDLDLEDKDVDTSMQDSDIHIDYLSNEDAFGKDTSYTNTDDEDVFALDDNNLGFDFSADDTEHKDEDIMSLDSMWDEDIFDDNGNKESSKASKSSKEGNRLGDVFSEVLGAVDTLADKELENLIGEIPKAEPKKENIFVRFLSGFKKKAAKSESDVAKKAAKPKKAKPKKEKADSKKQKDETLEEKTSASKKAKPAAKKKKAAAKPKQAKEKVAAKPKKVKAVKKEKSREQEEAEVVVKISGRTYAFVIGFALFLFAFIVLSTNLYTYSLTMQYASTNFDRGQYSEAYYEIYGTNIKKKDRELYEKIVTVMHVNRQLEAYSNYYEIQKYPKALDSLIKGIKRYNQYIDYGKELGVEEDMNLVRHAILVELEDKFQISEKKAEKLAKMNDMKEYSTIIYTLALENVSE